MSKERLEDIKKRFNNTLFSLARKNGKIQPYDDLMFLFEQAERVQELEEDREYLQGVINNASKRMRFLKIENETLSAHWNDAQKEILVLKNKLECDGK